MPTRTASWISICYHPILFGIGCFLLILYRFFPYLFSLFVESAPVIGFTLLLLGLLLIYGEQDDPIAEEYDPGTEVVSSSEPESTTLNHVVKRRERKVDSNLVNRRTSKASAVKETVLVDRFSDSTSNVRDTTSTAKVNNEIEKVNRKGKRLINGSKPHKFRPAGRGHENAVDDSSVASSMHRVGHKHASSDSESDVCESSSSSDAEVLPMLDDLDPLLDSEAAPTAQASKYNSDDGLSAYDRESDDGSMMEETENAEDEDDDEKQEDKGEESKVVVKWTADDQRNLVDLAKSELERNRRLENLIAKRRQRKIMQHEMEKRNPNESLPGLNGNGQLSSIIVSRMNPFDLPYDDEDIPGSAPSILHPRRNPFDSPFDSSEPSDSGNTDNSNYQPELVAGPREMIFRRHESFSVGFGDVKQDRRFSKFRPYFEVEPKDSDEGSFSNMHDLLREIGDLRANNAPSGLVPLVTTNDENRAGIPQDSESSAKQNDEPTYQANRSLDEPLASDVVLHKQDNKTAQASEKAEVIDEEYELGSSSSTPRQEKEVDTHESASTGGLLLKKTEESASSKGDEAGVDLANWVASPSLSSVDKIESTSREITLIKEKDVLGVELSKVRGDYGSKFVPVLPESAERQSVLTSMNAAETASREGS